MEKRSAVFLVFVVIIIAGFLRLNQLKTAPPGLYPDEAMNGNNALEALRTGQFKVFYPENNGREGLFVDIQAIFLKIFGQNEPWVLRLPSAIFGILTVLGIYFLTKEMFSREVAFLSSFFLAVSFWHVNFSRIGFRAIMAPFFLVWASYLFFLSVKNNSDLKKYLPLAALGGATLGLGLYSYIAYRIMPLIFLFTAALLIKKENVWKIFLIFTAAAVIVFLPLGIYFLQNPADFLGRTSQVSIFSSSSPVKDLLFNTVKTLGMFNFVGDHNWRHNIGGKPELSGIVGILFLIGIIFSVREIFRRENGGGESRLPYLFLFFWSLLGMLPVVISDEGIPHALRSILLLPPVMIFSALGGAEIYKAIRKHLSPAGLKFAVAAFLLVLVLQTYYSYFVLWAKNSETYDAFSSDYVEIGKKINELPPEIPKYVIVKSTGGVEVRGIPMPAQTVMFITDTFDPNRRAEKNVHYLTGSEEDKVPGGSIKFYLR